MKLRQLCDNLGIKYNEKNPKLSLNKIKKEAEKNDSANKMQTVALKKILSCF